MAALYTCLSTANQVVLWDAYPIYQQFGAGKLDAIDTNMVASTLAKLDFEDIKKVVKNSGTDLPKETKEQAMLYIGYLAIFSSLSKENHITLFKLLPLLPTLMTIPGAMPVKEVASILDTAKVASILAAVDFDDVKDVIAENSDKIPGEMQSQLTMIDQVSRMSAPQIKAFLDIGLAMKQPSMAGARGMPPQAQADGN